MYVEMQVRVGRPGVASVNTHLGWTLHTVGSSSPLWQWILKMSVLHLKMKDGHLSLAQHK